MRYLSQFTVLNCRNLRNSALVRLLDGLELIVHRLKVPIEQKDLEHGVGSIPKRFMPALVRFQWTWCVRNGFMGRYSATLAKRLAFLICLTSTYFTQNQAVRQNLLS